MKSLSVLVLTAFLVGGVWAQPAVNEQITDVVPQINVKVLGDSPAEPMGALYQTIQNSLDLMFVISPNQIAPTTENLDSYFPATQPNDSTQPQESNSPKAKEISP